MRTWMVAIALLVAAGCLSKPAAKTDYDAVESELAKAARAVLVQDHGDAGGHFQRAGHTGAYNVERIGYSNGVDDSGDANAIPSGGSYTELAVSDGFAYLAKSSADGTFGGFSIIDTHDPAHPVVTGSFDALGLADLEVDPEQHYAFAATQRNMPQQIIGAIQANQNLESATPRGIYIVDVSQKDHPVLDGFVPLPTNGPHTLTYLRHPNGQDYLVACTYDLVTDPVTGAIASQAPLTQRVIVFNVQKNPLADLGLPAAKLGLIPVAQYQYSEFAPPPLSGGSEEPRLVFPHDARMSIHPFTGQVLLEVAYWDHGAVLLDISHLPSLALAVPDVSMTPILPVVGGYTLFAPSAQNNIHLVQSMDAPLLAGDGSLRAVTVAEPEIISAETETGYLTFLDTTDPADIQKLSHWTLPAMNPPLFVTDLDFSPHNFDTWGGKVAVAHYHAGVWVIDVSTPETLAHPRSVGYYLGDVVRDNSPVEQPKFWGVFERGGLLYASDEATGLHILRYTGP